MKGFAFQVCKDSGVESRKGLSVKLVRVRVIPGCIPCRTHAGGTPAASWGLDRHYEIAHIWQSMCNIICEIYPNPLPYGVKLGSK